MKKIMLMLSVICFCISGLSLRAQTDDSIPLPKDFRKWATVKTVLIGPQSAFFATEGGIHHIYANDKAMEGYESGKFPKGSEIVYELLETREAAGNTIEGPARRVDVMVKQDEVYGASGGWGFASFPKGDPNSPRLTAERQASCFACHGKHKVHDSVFSEFRK